jgi:NADH dehydrogenase
MITVFGATGDLGSRIVRLLRGQGHPVRAVSRARARLDAAVSLGAEPTLADLRRPETLEEALRGTEVVITTANAVLGTRDNDVRRVDLQGNASLIDAARRRAVRRFVFVSAHGARPDSPVDFLRAKAATEKRLEASGLQGAILRPSAFLEIWAALLGDPVLVGKAVQVFGRGENPIAFVASDDVARIAAALGTGPERPGVERVELGGPGNLTALQVVEIFSRLSGRPARIRHVPRTMLRVLPALLGPLAPNPARLMSAALWLDTADHRIAPGPVMERFGQLVSAEQFARERIARPSARSVPPEQSGRTAVAGGR